MRVFGIVVHAAMAAGISDHVWAIEEIVTVSNMLE